MSKIARFAQTLLIAGVVAAAIAGTFGIVDLQARNRFDVEDKWTGADSLQTVIGDSTTYTFTHHLFPAGKDTTDAVDTRRCDLLSMAWFGSGDSLAYWVQYTIDGTNWLSLADSTFVNAAESADYPPTTASWNTIVYKQFNHIATSGVSSTVHLDGWMLPQVRAIVQNADLSDTLFNSRIRFICGD